MKRHLAAAALLVAFSVPAFAQDAVPLNELPGWDIAQVAHRGLAPGLPENTLAAFEDVAARGVKVIEIDLRGTADGDVVIMHDETVDRTTDGSGEVTSMTLAEIQDLDAGSWVDGAYAGEKVPTYEEAISFAQDHGIMLLLDIKQSDVLDRRKIVDITEKHNATLNVIVGVRSLEDLAEFRSYNPNLRTLGFIPNPEAIDDFAEAGVEIIRLWPQWIRGEDSEQRGEIPAYCEGVENCLVKQVQGHGRPVWTTAGEADRAELIGLIDAGVNGILTDVPDVLSELMDDIRTAQGSS